MTGHTRTHTQGLNMYASTVNIDNKYHACIVVDNVCYTDETAFVTQKEADDKARVIYSLMVSAIQIVLAHANFTPEAH